MKRKTAALYDPYLDTFGGGERHILSVMQVLEKAGYDIVLFWDRDVSQSLKDILHLEFERPVRFEKNIFDGQTTAFAKIHELKQYDIFVYVTDGSYFYSSAKATYIFSMVPDKKLYAMSLTNRIKTHNATFISNSLFTQSRLQSWGIPSKLLYPYIDENFLTMRRSGEDDRIILSVGRFFQHLHSKRQDTMITTFKELKKNDKRFTQYRLVLAGGLKKQDNDYFERLQSLAGRDKSIELMPNIPYADLVSLYRKARFYWHFAGYGIDDELEPQNVEHLGMTPLEAMAAGCITYCYNAGGPKEIIRDGENGFLFNDTEELFLKMQSLAEDDNRVKDMRKKAREYVTGIFSYEAFRKNTKQVFGL